MPRPKTGDTRKMVTLPAELAQAIEEYRFANRYKTEAEAIRRLIEAGIQALVPQRAAKKIPDKRRRT
jgi:Arc/MetJ-type ribon-helix-helix transcriptional regulator